MGFGIKRILNSSYAVFSNIRDSFKYRINNGFSSFCGNQFNRFSIDYKCFDGEYYLKKYPDIIHNDPYAHFVIYGYNEGREGRFFDKLWYLDFHKDVKNLGVDAFYHYNKYGKKEGRKAKFINIKSTNVSGNEIDYTQWLLDNNEFLIVPRETISNKIDNFEIKPKISIILPVYNPPIQFLESAIQSVINQSYSNWELCICDDASNDLKICELIKSYEKQDKRIKTKFRKKNGHISAASNDALKLATGQYIGLLDHDDLLFVDALFYVVEAINNNPDLKLIYSDEDKCDEKDSRFDPYFKSDFNYELLLAQNMICHFSVYDAKIMQQINGFRIGFEGAQDYDLVLRFIEKINPNQIHHISRVLYHWRAISGSTALNIDQKTYAKSAGLRAVTEHIERTKQNATVIDAPELSGHNRVRYSLPSPLPLISIIIPTRDMMEVLKQCIDSIFKKTTYSNFEIIIADNQSNNKNTIEYFEKIASDKVKIVNFNQAFNYSKINNYAAQFANGEFIVLLNNDIEVISPDWLEEMLSFAQRSDTGCVGARLWYPDNTLQHGGVILGIGGVAGHAHKYLPKGHTGYFGRAVHHQQFSAVTGACLMIKKSIFDEVGGLNEDLAVAFNDIDFCLKVMEKGYRNIWTPYAELYHHESKSRGAEDTEEKLYRFNKEREKMILNWEDTLKCDNFYNKNLSDTFENFQIKQFVRY